MQLLARFANITLIRYLAASVGALAVDFGSFLAFLALGDVAIATGVATRQARAAGHTLGTELRVLALHGLLHLLGFDHETDSGRMARTEAKLRRAGRLTEGLIERGRPAIRAAKSAAATRARR